jgi:hypothetical protein
VLPPAAGASQFIDVVQGRTPVELRVDRSGRAMLYYAKPSGTRHVLVGGAVNARSPNPSVRQVRFHVDYSGGWQSTHQALWKTFRSVCAPYDGPALPFLVAACRAPNGSYWAVQEWRVDLPNLGFPPWTVRQRSLSLHVSHWNGPLAQLEVHTDWVYGHRFHEVFGRATYRGVPVHGFRSTVDGAPLDGYGRLIYLDTLDSRYGTGWRRENAFLPHGPNGIFCHGFFRADTASGGHVAPPGYRGRRGPGNGKSYRLTFMGPGVTPDVSVVVPGLHDYSGSAGDRAYEAAENAILDRLAAGGRWCHHH